jgi:putative membrane protein
MAFLTPASENDHPFYLIICGVVATCSMIIPGLSGSFVLLLMGNYKLIMIESVNALSSGELGEALRILVPVGLGAVVGVIALARVLSWLFRTWHDIAVALITGFIAGSLVIIWPWKDTLTETFVREGEEKEKITGFEHWHLPDFGAGATWAALGVMMGGVVLIVLLEVFAARPGPAEEKAP